MPIRRFLAHHGWLIAIAVTYLYAFPYFPKIQSANELPRVYLVKAIADESGFAIDRGVARWGSTADVSESARHKYSNKAPGSSMLAAPPYRLIRMIAGSEPSLATSMWICRVFAGIIPALLFLLLMYRFLERYVPDPAIRQLTCLAYGLGSMAMTYSILFYSHQLGAICIASAWIFGLDAADKRRGRYAFAAAGALAGCAALADYQAVFAAVPIAVHVIVKLWSWPLRETLKGVALAVAGAVVPITILLAYHAVCFGSPWRTGYDASETFAHFHQRGFLGITELRWDALFGSTVKIDNGLLALAPWLGLAIPGAFVLARGLHLPRTSTARLGVADRWRATIEIVVGVALVKTAILIGSLTSGSSYLRYASIAMLLVLGAAVIVIGAARLAPARGGDFAGTIVGLATLAIYLLFISSINFWRGGWEVGPRYIVVVLPFLLPFVTVMLAALRRFPIARGIAIGLVLVGIAIYTLSSLTFPYWPDSMSHPLYDVTFRMLRENLVAPNVASAAGIDGVLGIVPVLLLVAGVVGWAIHRVAGWLGLAIAVAVAAFVLAAYGFLPRGGPQAERAFGVVRNAVLQR